MLLWWRAAVVASLQRAVTADILFRRTHVTLLVDAFRALAAAAREGRYGRRQRLTLVHVGA